MDSKTCSKCGVQKGLDCFHLKKTENRLSSWCKDCFYKLQKTRWIDRKIKAVELLGGKCSICGYDKNLASLNFHHINPTEKEFGWPKLKEQKWESIVKELKKCSLICANCHCELHHPHLDKTNIVYFGSDNNSLNQDLKRIENTGLCICGEILYGTKYCSVKCVNFANRKVKRPEKEILAQKIESMSWLAIGKEYGVSDNAVRKWAKNYELI
mgnify:CR=1 FL=1